MISHNSVVFLNFCVCLSLLPCPSLSFVLPPSLYHSLEIPVLQIHSFVSLGCNHISHLFLDNRQSPSCFPPPTIAAAFPQIATAHITLQNLIYLCLWSQLLCASQLYPFSFPLAWKYDSGTFLPYARGQFAPLSSCSMIPSVKPPFHGSALPAEPRWLPSKSICGQRRSHLHEHVSHHLADIPLCVSHREEWNHTFNKVLSTFFWSNTSLQFWCFAIFPPLVWYLRISWNTEASLNVKR